MYDSEAILNPDFRLLSADEKGVACKDLYMQTFFSLDEPDVWYPDVGTKWPKIARIFSDRIVTFPIFTNPHAKRYLSRRHGRIKTITYEMDSYDLPDAEDQALILIDWQMPRPVWNECAYGLGLAKELDPLWHGLVRLPDIESIVITQDSKLEIVEGTARIPRDCLDEMRRIFVRTDRKLRERIHIAKQWHVRNEILAKLSPERFPAYAQLTSTGELVEYRMVGNRPSPAAERHKREASIRTVRESAEQIARDSPRELINLHAEIERVTLATMIERFEKKLSLSLPEAQWQTFFEENIFILSLLFARPVKLLHAQFHAQSSHLDGSGSQIGDFLFRELGQSLAIIEIKKPSSPLMQTKAYRNDKVYGPHAELSGAVTQVLFQKASLQNNWLYHQSNLKNSLPDTISCIVIAGITPTEAEQRRCFDIFRHACKDVDVVTFDELLGKLKLLLHHLTPPATERDNEDPF
ncbi:hypothetical protein [Pseudomonas sp. 34 E 7]|uniref:Shedu immune nuclease family protein n=1 Tax=Pseudomonas sp. 34 E 7 TaxID=1844102 RepID=UPI000812B145|nr:Shedu immune nuclease family protein [Pseudomonas sp. 34 E 7]CRN00036.1 hypothetical protein [Pseudomonas sp. 34 E 7]